MKARGRFWAWGVGLTLGLGGCAHRPRDEAAPSARPAPEVPGGVRHRVAVGETLYRIAKTYGVSVESLMAANGLKDARELAVGQTLLIPGARGVEEPERGIGLGERDTGPAERSSGLGEPGANPGARGGAAPAERRRVQWPPPVTEVGEDPGEPVARGRRGAAPVPSHPSARRGMLSWPLRGVLYGRFGKKGREPHDGIDLAAPEGTPVKAAAEGKVLFAGEQRGYGQLVIVEHEAGLVTLYAHNRDVRVKTDQRVRAGQVVATVGESGRTSGPHLHFEVRRDGEPVNPLDYLSPP